MLENSHRLKSCIPIQRWYLDATFSIGTLAQL
jgi:hypothetical protein